MPLQKTIVVNGLTATDAFHKIARLLITPTVTEEGESYSVEIQVKSYTDATMSNQLKDQYFTMTTDSENDLTLTAAETFLIDQPFFEDAEIV